MKVGSNKCMSLMGVELCLVTRHLKQTTTKLAHKTTHTRAKIPAKLTIYKVVQI